MDWLFGAGCGMLFAVSSVMAVLKQESGGGRDEEKETVGTPCAQP